MEINSKLKKVASVFLDRRTKKQLPYVKLKKYINQLENSNDLIERSYLQYQCQMYIQGRIFKYMTNIASWILYPMIIYKVKHSKIHKNNTQYEAVFNCYDIDVEILPDSLKTKYISIFYNKEMNGYYVDKELMEFINSRLKKYKFSRYFYLKTIMKLSYYNYLINVYSCEAIIGYCEFSFTSSTLTEYCHYLDKKHINVMHGEKNFDIINSFSSFDDFYVWADFYRDLFNSLKIQSNYIIEIPPAIMWKETESDEYLDYTYYLTNPPIDALTNIINILTDLNKKGYKISIRPHPRYTNIEELRTICPTNIEIEDNKNLSIKESLKRTKSVISDFSTVLIQGLFANKKVIIDDISDPKIYFQMVDLKYGIVYKRNNYIKLSDFLRKEYSV